MDQPAVAAGATDPPGTLEALLRRERLIVLGGLALLCGLAWLATVRQALAHGPMSSMAMPQMQSWTAATLGALFVMWTVMMVAMMLPSATPMILMFATIARQRRARGRPFAPTTVFLLGYVATWTAFSAVAALAQWGMHRGAMLSPAMRSASPVVGGVLLLAAGAFQWTPLKRVCLTHCRSPLGFITGHWREGARGALQMGAHHGMHCVGCCWLLMTLLFVAGVMNLLWVAAIALFVVLEKVLPQGQLLGRLAGIVLAAWGVALLV